MDKERVRLRLHWGGSFQSSSALPEWKYVGGEVFNESVPAESKYFDLCRKLNEKVGYTTSIKYQAPGEELSPNELISITGDDDLQELYDEYFQALLRPGTHVKTFRVKIYLFPALQLELDTEARPLESQAQLLLEEGEEDFDPEDWCAPTDEEDDLGYAEDERIVCPQAETQWHADHQQGALAWQQDELPPGVMPAFMDRPAGTTAGLFGAGHSGSSAGQEAMDLLHRHAIGNLLRSISRSVAMQHPKGITEEIGLLDPYHEQDDEHHGAPAVVRPLQQKRERDMDVHHDHVNLFGMEPVHIPGDRSVAHVQEEGHLGANADADANRHSSLVGNLPSHISIFGSDGRKAGRALSAGADDGVACSPQHGAGSAAESSGEAHLGKLHMAFRLPSHISIFGSNNQDVDVNDADIDLASLHVAQQDPAAAVLGSDDDSDSKCITQEFSRDASLMKLDRDAGLNDDADFGNDAVGSVSVSTPKLLDEVVKVPINEVHIIRKIGEGAFGEVSFANVESHGLVAVKWLKRDRFAKYSESFMREAEVLAKLNHPNIIRMYGVVIEPVDGSFAGSTLMGSGTPGAPEQTCIIAGIMTDYVRGGSLSGQLRAAKRRPTLKERCQVAVQAARGMAFLHAQNPAVIHFDLKPDNLLVDGDGETLHVKVADFGLSKHKFQTFVSCRDLRGTLPYMAPELVSNPNQVSERCDVWSMGVVMWEMYTLEVPYYDMSAQQILMALMHGNIHLHVPSSCEPEWRGLIEMCMDPNPEARPSFKQLTTHLDALLRQLY